MAFYKVTLTRCSCGKPATHEVQASGNVSYGKYCEKCADKRVKELEKYWKGKQPI